MLIIGPRYNNKVPSLAGGIVVLFENWIEYCNRKNIRYSVVDTNKLNYSNVLFAYISIIIQIIRKGPKSKTIFLHGTIKDYLFIAPIVVFISKIFHRKVFLRKFAGSFEEYYNKTNKLYQKLFNYVLVNSDITFWETKSLVSFGKKLNKQSYWFPNIRIRSRYLRSEREKYSKKFVFLSQVKKEKGIDYLIKSFSSIGKDSHIDIYGPLIDISENELNGSNYSYKGCVSPDDVYKILSEYDVLVLPSFWKNEGYPGIIIEAFSVGIPVIATEVGGIPEIVKDRYNGILIPPKDSDALCDAIKYINDSNYAELAMNARKSFDDFDSDIVNDRILKIILSDESI